jgi:hypothetical protein
LLVYIDARALLDAVSCVSIIVSTSEAETDFPPGPTGAAVKSGLAGKTSS